jgi:hypothetical protein
LFTLLHFEKVSRNVIFIGAINSRLIQSLKDKYFKQLEVKWECYSYKLLKHLYKNIKQALVVGASDSRDIAYGPLSLSEKIGVSPWHWWADAHPEKKEQLSLDVRQLIAPTPP